MIYVVIGNMIGRAFTHGDPTMGYVLIFLAVLVIVHSTMTDTNTVRHNQWGDESKSRDPIQGDWKRLDQSPPASAQMIEWYAPETAKVLKERA